MKMLIGPIIFLTVVIGIAGVSDVKKVGRVGVKAILYFEVVSTFALVIGLLVVNTLKPGAGFNVDPATLDADAVARYAQPGAERSGVQFFLDIIPKTFLDAFSGNGDLLQVLLRRPAVRLRPDRPRRARQARARAVPGPLEGVLPHDGHDHAPGADRCRSARWPSRSASTASTASARWRG